MKVARRQVLGLVTAGALAPLACFGQPRFFRVGFLGAASPAGFATRIEALRAGLRERGYVEGRNLALELRWAESKYDRLEALAQELLRSKIEVLVTHGTPGTLAAKRATTSVPIVMAVGGDPVASGIVKSFARPEANVTGSAFQADELAAKRLELLKETLPRMGRMAFLTNPANPVGKAVLHAMDGVAGGLKVSFMVAEARNPAELEAAFSAMRAGRVEALSILDDGFLLAQTAPIANLANAARLPSIGGPELAEAGGLMGYTVDNLVLWRRAAYFVDRLLKGAKPAELPIERGTQFVFVVNLKTARALDINIPQPVLQRADRVIQ